MKISTSISLLVICFVASSASPALNREANDSDEVVVPLDDESRVIAGRWAPFGFGINFNPWSNPFTSGFGDLLKHLKTQVNGALGNPQANSTSKTEVIDGRKVTVNETMFYNNETGMAFHMKVINVQPLANSTWEDSRDVFLSAPGEDDGMEMEDSRGDSTNGEEEEQIDEWKQAVEGLKALLSVVEEDESSTGEVTSSDKSQELADKGQKLDASTGAANSSKAAETTEEVAKTTEMKHEAASTREPHLDNEIHHKEEDVETYYNPHSDEDVKILEPRGYLPHSYDNDVNNEVDVFETYKPINMERDTLVNQLMSDQQHKSGLVMIDPDAELFDVKDGQIIKTYYNPQQRFQKIFT